LPPAAGVLHSSSCTVSQTSETIDRHHCRQIHAFGVRSASSAQQDRCHTMTQRARKASPNPRSSFNSRPNFGPRSNPVSIVSPHPCFKFRPPLIPGFRVSEQPYKSHSVPLTVVEQPEQDPANDLRGECVACAERPNASTSRQTRRTRAPREEPRRPRRRPARSALSTSPTPSDQTRARRGGDCMAWHVIGRISPSP